ncbi:MAG: integrin alpha, partial [Chthoniobacteraceae bacterium]
MNIECLEARIAPAAVANIDLSGLTGAIGFKISGEEVYDRSGTAVSGGGDINGDGIDDFIIGTYGANTNGYDAGATYIVFGRESGFGGSFDLATLDGSNGFKVIGEAASDLSGVSVSSAGDVNGDGFDDVIIGASSADGQGINSGASYVIYGKASGFAASLSLATLDGLNGSKISGAAAYDYSGIAVSSAGDVNGDGFDDVVIGAFLADSNGLSSGASYVVFGRANGFGANLDLSSLRGPDGFKISGVSEYDRSGSAVGGAGDINGDGFDDVIIGAPSADSSGYASGATYIVFGKSSGFAANLDVSTLDGTNGFQITGEGRYDVSGHAVSGAGDVNGDGFDDFLVGAPGTQSNRGLQAAEGGVPVLASASYVVFGKAGGIGAILNLSSLDGTNGFKITGVGVYDQFGFTVSRAGDINGDDFDDLIVGAPYAQANGVISGAAYVVFGQANAFAATLAVSTLDGSNGFKISGTAAGDEAGFAVSGAGDVNDDGFDDIIVGARLADANGSDSGASYVIYGFETGDGGDDGGLVIGKTGKSATFTDVDGDQVTIKVSTGALTGANISFDANGNLAIDLTDPTTKGSGGKSFSKTKLVISSKAKDGGDGMVDVGVINAGGMSLKSVKVDGDLGKIDAGEGVEGKTAFKKLSANSIGFSASPGAESNINGKVGVLKIKHDVKGVMNVTAGLPEDAGLSGAVVQAINKVVIGGDIDGSDGGAKAGLLRVSGDIKSVVVKGSVSGGA